MSVRYLTDRGVAAGAEVAVEVLLKFVP